MMHGYAMIWIYIHIQGGPRRSDAIDISGSRCSDILKRWEYTNEANGTKTFSSCRQTLPFIPEVALNMSSGPIYYNLFGFSEKKK